MELGRRIAIDAKKKGICKAWYDELKTFGNNVPMLAEMYLKGLDFCMRNNFPDNEFIRRNLKGAIEAFGIHLDETIDIINPEKVVALGSTTGVVKLTDYGIAQITTNDNADITVTATDNSIVFIDAWGKSKVRVQASKRCRVRIVRFSPDATVEVDRKGKCDIRTRDKFEGSNLHHSENTD